jgi:hypothetical protein
VSEPKINYLGPASEAAVATLQRLGYTYNSGELWRPPIGKKPDFDLIDTLRAEREALHLRLNAADQRIDELERDKARLDALEANCWDVRYYSSPNGDAGDSSISIEIVGHWMDKPTERVVGETYSENLRAAIDQAMTAPAYPPARPEYPEIDEALEASAIQ